MNLETPGAIAGRWMRAEAEATGLSIHVDRGGGVLAGRDAIEIVERKGIGHPDTLADGIAELASIRYSQYCLANFGLVLHHNLDKVAVFGGLARFSWTDGEYIRPLRVIFGGRASFAFGTRKIPVRDILEAAALDQLIHALPGMNRTKLRFIHLTSDSSMYRHWFKPRDAADLPEAQHPVSNDAAYLVAAEPRTSCESLALAIEAKLAAQTWAGSDIKVLLHRTGRDLSVACNVPCLPGFFADATEYRHLVTSLKHDVRALIESIFQGRLVSFKLRPIDDISSSTSSPQECYVNVSGSAVDYGEDGMVGRGNGRHGLITPNLRAGNEVLFGKNPAYHVGKVGALLADRAALELGKSGPSRIAIIYRRGDQYHAPFECDIQTESPLPINDISNTVLRTLATTNWVNDLVVEERYRVLRPELPDAPTPI